MTPRDYYNQIKDTIENSDYSELYCNILELIDEKSNLSDVRLKTKSLYNMLVAEINLPRGDQDFYDGYKEEFLREMKEMSEDIDEAGMDELSEIATAYYDALVIEKIRTFSYEIFQKGGINNYVQLASDIQDCYLDDLKEDGLYDEWKGAEYADIDAKIGDGPKLQGY